MSAFGAREEILARVRAGKGGRKVSGFSVAELVSGENALGPQPRMQVDLVQRFCDKALAQSCTLERLPDTASTVLAVRRYLEQILESPHAVITPELVDLAWGESGIDVTARAAVDADRVGISAVFCAIAETGTLMLLSGAEAPASVSLLPETHVAILHAGRIVPTMEAAFALLQVERGQLPRAVNFVSGPSRTGDIEQTIVLGAHGPCRGHIILIGDAS